MPMSAVLPARCSAPWKPSHFSRAPCSSALPRLQCRAATCRPRGHVRAAAAVASPQAEDAADVECAVDCVKELRSLAEWEAVLEGTKDSDQLVVVDFFKRACGACKYIQPGFVKLCSQAATEHKPVVFYKHNVVDEEDGDEDQTELAHKLVIKNVPMFKFFKRGAEVDSFATRDRLKVAAAINRHAETDAVHEQSRDEDE